MLNVVFLQFGKLHSKCFSSDRVAPLPIVKLVLLTMLSVIVVFQLRIAPYEITIEPETGSDVTE